MKKKKRTEEDEENPGEWWKPDYVPPPPPKESKFSKLKTKLSSINIRDRTPMWRTRKPTFLTVKCLVALVLFFIYLATALMTMTTNPFILILLIPTCWILLDYIKRVRRKS